MYHPIPLAWLAVPDPTFPFPVLLDCLILLIPLVLLDCPALLALLNHPILVLLALPDHPTLPPGSSWLYWIVPFFSYTWLYWTTSPFPDLALLDRPILVLLALPDHPTLPSLPDHPILLLHLALLDHLPFRLSWFISFSYSWLFPTFPPSLPVLLVHPIHLDPLPLLDHQINHKVQVQFGIFLTI